MPQCCWHYSCLSGSGVERAGLGRPVNRQCIRAPRARQLRPRGPPGQFKHTTRHADFNIDPAHRTGSWRRARGAHTTLYAVAGAAVASRASGTRERNRWHNGELPPSTMHMLRWTVHLHKTLCACPARACVQQSGSDSRTDAGGVLPKYVHNHSNCARSTCTWYTYLAISLIACSELCTRSDVVRTSALYLQCEPYLQQLHAHLLIIFANHVPDPLSAALDSAKRAL